MNTILTSVVVITAIAGFLAFLLSIANRTIGNYGTKCIIVNGEKELLVDGGDTLLSSLMSQDIFIPSACGGKGSCGYCKIQVVEGGGPILATETGYVTEKEQTQHYRLACQCKVKEDLKVQIPKDLLNVKQYQYQVTEIKDMTPTIKRIGLSLPADQTMPFVPGQYIQILTPVYKGSDEEVYRAYSVASSTEHTDRLELLIGYEAGGKCTTYVHQYLKVKDTLTVIGPYGEFFYHPGEKPMVFVAIGTGMAPLLAIIRHMHATHINRQATFYFGAKTSKDLFYIEELEAIAKDMPNFTFVPCLSRAEPDEVWHGKRGRVTDLIESDPAIDANWEGYLCGSPVMIDSVVTLLKTKGIPEDAIYYDKFE